MGKPRLEGWATDLGVTASEIKLLRKHVAKWARPRRAGLPLTAMPGRARIQPEPLGTVLIIASLSLVPLLRWLYGQIIRRFKPAPAPAR